MTCMQYGGCVGLMYVDIMEQAMCVGCTSTATCCRVLTMMLRCMLQEPSTHRLSRKDGSQSRCCRLRGVGADVDSAAAGRWRSSPASPSQGAAAAAARPQGRGATSGGVNGTSFPSAPAAAEARASPTANNPSSKAAFPAGHTASAATAAAATAHSM